MAVGRVSAVRLRRGSYQAGTAPAAASASGLSRKVAVCVGAASGAVSVTGLSSKVALTTGVAGAAVDATLFTAWSESRRNLFGDPRAVTGTSDFWRVSATTLSRGDGADFGTASTARFTATSNGAARGGPRVVLTPGSTVTVRFKVRASVAWANFALHYRPDIGSATNQTVVASGITLTTDVQTLEFSFTVGESSVGGVPGVYLVVAAGATGRWFELADVEVELGDTRGRGLIGSPRATSTERVRFIGPADASESVLEARAYTGTSVRVSVGVAAALAMAATATSSTRAGSGTALSRAVAAAAVETIRVSVGIAEAVAYARARRIIPVVRTLTLDPLPDRTLQLTAPDRTMEITT